MIVGKSLGDKITLQQFKKMSEKDQFAYTYTAIEAITHLEKASTEAAEFEERMRSRYGCFSLNKGVKEGREYYDDLFRNNQ